MTRSILRYKKQLSYLCLILLFAIGYKAFLPHFFVLKAPISQKESIPYCLDEKNEIQKILKQSWTFIGMGSQCFVFASEDGEYVIKVCKATRYRSFFDKAKKAVKQEADFTSYQIAFDSLQKESQITCLHLYQTNDLNTLISLKDVLGISHTFQADWLSFYIQKRAVSLTEYFKDALEKSSPSKIKELLKKMLFLSKSSCAQGLQMRDINPKNIGLYKGSPFWIDPGRIRLKPSFKTAELQEKKLKSFCYHLKPFLTSFDSAYEPLLEEALAESL